jgi:phosphoribosylanthranilate isomerase
MNIKVCGITEMKQLQQLDGLDIDFAGLIFYKESPRYIGEKISKSELKKADFDLKKVGVFVNPEMMC